MQVCLNTWYSVFNNTGATGCGTTLPRSEAAIESCPPGRGSRDSEHIGSVHDYQQVRMRQ